MIIVLLHRQPDQFNQVIQEMEAAGFAHIALTSVIASDQPLMKQALTAFGSDFRVRLAFDRFDSLRNELVTGVENIEEVLALSKVAPTAVLDVEERLGAGKISMLEAAHIPVGTGFDPGENPADAFKEAAIELTMRMPRISWDDYFMRIARIVASRGDCVKRRVAALIVRDRRIIATGYNGTPRATKNCGQGGCPRCSSFVPSGTQLGDCLCSHGEENAIIQAAYHGTSVNGATLYSTCSPCLLCTKMIINSGMAEVIYNAAYPLGGRSLELLRESGVKVRQYQGD